MKFRFGKTWEARRKADDARRNKLAKWHRHFALLPVVVGVSGDRYEYRWMEFVERSIESSEIYYGQWEFHSPRYRLPRT